MIIDLQRFLDEERAHWAQLEALLDRLARDVTFRMSLAQVRDFHRLYQRASADLARVRTFAAEPEVRRYLESLVARAYGELHESRRGWRAFSPARWFLRTFPRTFRRHARAFYLSVAITLAGGLFGGLAIALDADAKAVLMPWPHLQGDPAERVRQEESAEHDRLEGRKATFSSFLMTHNTRVSILALSLGLTWGIGTIALLFYNGVMLGAVVADYVLAGESAFLAGWLLPHGSIEIPAILIAGQGGLMLAGAMIGRGSRETLRGRLREIGGEVVTLIGGVAVMLVWAGIIEAFFSQYHEPFLPYAVKIGFGLAELAALACFLAWAGRGEEEEGRTKGAVA